MKQIGHYEFRALDKQQQITTLISEGIFLHETTSGSVVTRLFSMVNFYAAISFNLESFSLFKIRTFVNPEIVDEYLSGIIIADL